MFVNNLNPVIFEVGSLEIRWYGLIYVIAFVSFYFYLRYLAKKNHIENLKVEDVEDYLIGTIIYLVIGARFFHVFIYHPGYYFANPIEILQIWNGGLSFHGALLMIGLWTFYFCRKRKIIFFTFTDYMVFPVAVFLALGRFTNFINGELVGKITQVPWAVKFNNSGYNDFRHPTQIYESIKNLFLLTILYGVRGMQGYIFRKNVPGLLTAIFLIGYGGLRFIIEFLKEGYTVILGLNMGQILSLATLLFGIYLLKIIIQTRKAVKNMKITEETASRPQKHKNKH